MRSGRATRGQRNAFASRGRVSAWPDIFCSTELRYNCSAKIHRVNSIDKAAFPSRKNNARLNMNWRPVLPSVKNEGTGLFAIYVFRFGGLQSGII